MAYTELFSQTLPNFHNPYDLLIVNAMHQRLKPEQLQDARWSVSSTESVDGVDELLLRPHACPFPGCPQRFKRKYTLKDHYKSHTGEKPFVCPVRACRKTFTTSGNLARHKRLHPWLDKPLACLVDGCGCEFPNEEKLERHMLSHFDESSVHCCEVANCGRVFSTPGNLRRHVRHSHAPPRRHESYLQAPRTSLQSRPTVLSVRIPPRLVQLVPRGDRQGPVTSSFEVERDAKMRELPSSSHVHDQLPSDEELLETLACLFDEEDHDVGVTPPRMCSSGSARGQCGPVWCEPYL